MARVEWQGFAQVNALFRGMASEYLGLSRSLGGPHEPAIRRATSGMVGSIASITPVKTGQLRSTTQRVRTSVPGQAAYFVGWIDPNPGTQQFTFLKARLHGVPRMLTFFHSGGAARMYAGLITGMQEGFDDSAIRIGNRLPGLVVTRDTRPFRTFS